MVNTWPACPRDERFYSFRRYVEFQSRPKTIRRQVGKIAHLNLLIPRWLRANSNRNFRYSQLRGYSFGGRTYLGTVGPYVLVLGIV